MFLARQVADYVDHRGDVAVSQLRRVPHRLAPAHLSLTCGPVLSSASPPTHGPFPNVVPRHPDAATGRPGKSLPSASPSASSRALYRRCIANISLGSDARAALTPSLFAGSSPLFPIARPRPATASTTPPYSSTPPRTSGTFSPFLVEDDTLHHDYPGLVLVRAWHSACNKHSPYTPRGLMCRANRGSPSCLERLEVPYVPAPGKSSDGSTPLYTHAIFRGHRDHRGV